MQDLLSIRYVDDHVLLSDTEAWAYFRVPTVSTEFATDETQLQLATGIALALGSIRMSDTEIHLRIAYRTYPATTWAQDLYDRTPDGPGWFEYMRTMYEYVWSKQFWTKEVYLGVRLGQRSTSATNNPFHGLLQAFTRAETALGFGDHQISQAELAKWTDQAERLGKALSASSLYARHASSEELVWLIRHTLTGTIQEPRPSASPRRVWGAGELAQLAEGAIYPSMNRLRLQQPDGTEAWAAHLAFARFPDRLPFPAAPPWLHHADSLMTCPVEVSSRMRLVPPAKASKDVSRQLAHARDMDSHIRGAGEDAPLALTEQIDTARALEHEINKERLPFVYGRHRLMVTAATEQDLTDRVDALVEHYRDLDIDVLSPSGDQWDLLRESLPGDRPRVGAYAQQQPVITVAGGLPTATVELGDRPDPASGGWIGPYIGETFREGRSPVHFDPLVAAARNRPTAVAITGEPGGGKTTLALLLIYQMALRGVTIAAIDPKGDAENLVQLLQDQGRKARIMSLGAAQPGLLDPFAFGDDLAAKKTMATETLRLLLPRMSEEREAALIQAVGAVANQPEPSLAKVVDHLVAAEDATSRNLGAVLGSMSEMRLASLCFDPHGQQRIDTEGWTTVFTLGGLTLPDMGVDRVDYSYEQRLSVTLLYLVSQFARRLMNGLDRRLPKAIFLDEAWAVTSTPEGAKLVPEVSRMGRSRNTALILVSQNAGDMLNEQVTNCVSSVFAFRSSEAHEVAAVMDLLGVEASDINGQALRNLGNGECIFRDLDERSGLVDVDLISPELLERLDTNPTAATAQTTGGQ